MITFQCDCCEKQVVHDSPEPPQGWQYAQVIVDGASNGEAQKTNTSYDYSTRFSNTKRGDRLVVCNAPACQLGSQRLLADQLTADLQDGIDRRTKPHGMADPALHAAAEQALARLLVVSPALCDIAAAGQGDVILTLRQETIPLLFDTIKNLRSALGRPNG